MRGTCSIPGCDQPLGPAHGWCWKHYRIWYRTGDVHTPPRAPLDPLELVWRHIVVRGPDDCWPWTSTQTSTGYGSIGYGPRGQRRSMVAHRAAYMSRVAPIPEGMDLDHLCSNRLCCNPAHLEPVTHAENNRRSLARRGY